MFDLSITEGMNSKADVFYVYAKALAILQENLDDARLRNDEELINETRKEVIEAMRRLVRQVQSGSKKLLDIAIEPMQCSLR